MFRVGSHVVSRQPCCFQRTVVDNALLMYVSSYRSGSAHLNLKNAVMNHYTAEAIATARQIMEDSVKTAIPDHPLIGKKRTTSVNRSASDANLEDIVEMFKSLDKCENEEIPQYVCSNARSLPPAAPEAAGNMLAVLESVAAQQRQITQMQETMTNMRLDIESANDKAIKNEDKIDKIVLATGISAKSNSEAECVPRKQAAKETRSTPALTEQREKKTDKGNRNGLTQAQENNQQVDSNDEEPQAGIDLADQEPSTYAASLKAQPKDMEDNGFKKGGKRPNKGGGTRKQEGQGQKSIKNLSKGGTGDSDLLKAGPEQFMVQITNVNSSLDGEKIKEYLTSKGVEVITVEDTSSENWSTRRFVITLHYKDFSTVMATEFWPRRIFFKRWFPAKPAKFVKPNN